MPDMVFDGTYWVLEESIPIGTGGNRRVQFDASGKYPAADGSNITGLYFESTDNSYTNGGLITIAHSLSAAPKFFALTALCETADAGFSVGARVDVLNCWNSGSNYYGAVVYADATNVYIQVAAQGLRTVNAASLSTAFDINDWKLEVRAWVN